MIINPPNSKSYLLSYLLTLTPGAHWAPDVYFTSNICLLASKDVYKTYNRRGCPLADLVPCGPWLPRLVVANFVGSAPSSTMGWYLLLQGVWYLGGCWLATSVCISLPADTRCLFYVLYTLSRLQRRIQYMQKTSAVGRRIHSRAGRDQTVALKLVSSWKKN